MNRALITRIAALTLAFGALSGCAATTDVRPSVSQSAQCQEDDPCWDCHALGNRVCGPANDGERATAWDVWDYSNGAHSLKIDPSRAFRVEYVGNALTYPRNVAENETALVGKDGKWYVFRAAYAK